jgi:hypothetical protein
VATNRLHPERGNAKAAQFGHHLLLKAVEVRVVSMDLI